MVLVCFDPCGFPGIFALGPADGLALDAPGFWEGALLPHSRDDLCGLLAFALKYEEGGRDADTVLVVFDLDLLRVV